MGAVVALVLVLVLVVLRAVACTGAFAAVVVVDVASGAPAVCASCGP